MPPPNALGRPTAAGASGLVRFLNRLPQLWLHRPTPSKDAAAILAMFALAAVTALTGAGHTRLFGHDVFIALDGGWRILNGQRPHVDFGAGLGAVFFMFIATGLKLAHNSVDGVSYASAVFGLAVGLWGYALSRQRTAWLPSVLAATLLVLIGVGPFPLGFAPNQLSHAMLYSRYAYAIVGLVVVEGFLAPRRNDRNAALLGGISTGAACVVALFTKPNFGLVALGFAAGTLALVRHNRWRWAGLPLGFGAAGLAMLAYLRFDLAAVSRDFGMLAAARGTTFDGWAIRWALLKGLPEFAWLALLAVLCGLSYSRKKTEVAWWRPLALALLLFIGGGLLLGSNAQPGGYPLNAVFAILLTASAGEESEPAEFLTADAIVILVGSLCFAPTFFESASGLVYAALDAQRTLAAPQEARFHEPHLAPLFLYDVPEGTDAELRSNGRLYVTYVNDGVDLIRRVSGPDETVFDLDIANPFPYALLRRPPHGGLVNLSFQNSFIDAHKPTPQWLFGSADIVMVPKHPSGNETNSEALRRNYLSAVQSGFRLCAESDWWQLYKRPSNLSSCPLRP